MSHPYADWAQERIAKAAVSIAKGRGCDLDTAKSAAIALYPDVARIAGLSTVEKASGVWAQILEGADSIVSKDGAELSEDQRVEKFLKTRDGQALYVAYRAETQATQHAAGWIV
jgi:hypothetical protein